MAKTRRMLSMFLVALFTIVTCVSYIPAKAAEVLPKVALVGLSSNPAVVGDEQTLYLTAKGYEGKVQYKVFYLQRDNKDVKVVDGWKELGDWTAAEDAKTPVAFKVPAGTITVAKNYSFAIRVKRDGVDGKYSNQYGNYDDAYAFNNVFKDAKNADVEALTVDKTSVAVGEKVTVKGTEGKTYKLFSFKEDGTTRTDNKNMFTELAGMEFTPAAAGNYMLLAQLRDGNNVIGWKYFAINVVDKLQVNSVSAIDGKTLKVTFNGPVADATKLALTVKRDGINVSIAKTEWNEAKNEAKLSVSYKLQTGKYVVTGKYDGQDIGTVEAELNEAKAATIAFANNSAVLSADKKSVTVALKILDQYGNSIKASKDDLSVNYSIGTGFNYQDGTLTITNDTAFELGKSIVVTVVHKASLANTTDTLTISNCAEVKTIEIGEVATDDKDLKDSPIYVGDATKYYLPVTLRDQYGNELKASQVQNLTIVSSDRSVINIDSKVTEHQTSKKTILKFLAPEKDVKEQDGTAMVAMYALGGAQATKKVEVFKPAAVNKFDLLSPDEIVKQNVEVKIPFEAVDQYGKALVSASDLPVKPQDPNKKNILEFTDGTTITVTNAEIRAGIDYANKKARTLLVTPTDKKVFMSVITSSYSHDTLTLSAEASPVPTNIAGLKSAFKTAVQLGLDEKLDSNIKLIDQYGDSIKLIDGYVLDITAEDENFDAFTYAAKVIKAAAKGTEVIKVQLKKTADNTVVDEYSFAMECVDLKDITAFELADMGKLYTGAADADHAVEFELVGLKGTTKVLVDQTLILGAYASDSNLEVTLPAGDNNGNLAVKASKSIETKNTDSTVKLSVVVQGKDAMTLQKDVTINSAAPVAGSLIVRNPATYKEISDPVIVVKKGIDDAATLANVKAAFEFYAEDQYEVGKAVDMVMTNKIDAEGSDFVASYSNGTWTLTNAADGDSFVMTAFIDGFVKSVKIIIAE